MSGGSLPWFAHLLVPLLVLAWHIQALAGPGSGYAWAARGACRVGVRGCAQVAGQHAAAPRGASGGRPAGGGVAWAPRASTRSANRRNLHFFGGPKFFFWLSVYLALNRVLYSGLRVSGVVFRAPEAPNLSRYEILPATMAPA